MVAIPSIAQVFTVLANFDDHAGSPEYMSLVQGRDGNLYGTTYAGGSGGCIDGYLRGCGVVFKITTDGTLTTVAAFGNVPSGIHPFAGLVLADDGNFYGTTPLGGSGTCGTIFKVTPGGKLTTLYNFNNTDGCQPYAGLIQGADGNFYGTTRQGGSNFTCLRSTCGTVFKVSTGGSLTTLHSFNGDDGAFPMGPLLLDKDGNFYGTTSGSRNLCNNNQGCGTIFKMTPGGDVTTLRTFNYTDGAFPQDGLVQASSGDFYGTTFDGGNGGCQAECGTVFKITPSGQFTLLHNFINGDGADPDAGVIQATDGNFYGTTPWRGGYGVGTVYKMTPSGKFRTLHSFDFTDGADPYGGIVQATNGILYGTTNQGGTGFGGTVFSLDLGLSPFVRLARESGKVGISVGILGQGFTGTTSVSFNGTEAIYTVVSDTFLKATVPPGATKGFVTVSTPSGLLKSSQKFRVKQ
jgi:uncharacterized repeat protein (TIGR03803 family)